MRPAVFVALAVGLSLSTAFASTPLQITPTTTLAAETGNNTSTSNLFATTGNGDMAAGNVSKVDTHTLLYPGFDGKIYAHLMGWFCMTAGSTATGAGTLCGSHVQVGYNSNDPAVVHAQVNDMISRGFDGVIHDWYGPGNSSDDIETTNYMNEAQQHPNFTFALMIDKGAIEWYSCYPTCTATQALLNLTQYAANTYFNSPAYMRINGRPVLTNFDIDLHYTVDWNYVAANTPGNPIFIFQNSGGFTHTLSAGAYSWVIINSQYGLDYLTNFYNTGLQYPSELTVGAMYKGFNDTLASWSGNRVMSQQCGQTWLQTFAKANSMYNSSSQLGAIQMVTWDDYEEGTELETGIDNCLAVSGGMSNTTLKWNISGDESTLDHYTVFISTDGQNLMSLGDFAVGTQQLDLASYTPAVGSTYTLYVKAVGKPSMRNQISGPVTFSYTPGVHMTPSNGATVSSPMTLSGYAVSANPISAMIAYVDYNEVYRTYSGSLSTTLSLSSGGHLVVINAWDSTGALMQAQANISVASLSPNAALTLSSTSAVAPATITASTSGSTDPNSGGTISSSTINWGDGATSSGPNASHVYSQAGNYTVSATVTDNYGLSATTTKALTISAPSITISSPLNGSTVSSPVQVTAKAVSGLPISAIIVYLDNNEVYRTYSATVNTSISMGSGQHQIVTNAWDSAGTLMQAKVSITVKRRH